MRSVRAAAYLDMSESTFLRLVEERVFPKGTKIGNGIVVWDRYDLDSSFENLKRGRSGRRRNSMDELLGVHDDEDRD